MADPLLELTDVIPRIIVPEDTELELEIRFDIDERKPGGNRRNKYSPVETTKLFKRIITESLKTASCSIEQSINFMCDDSIKRLMFVNGVQDKSMLAHYEKQRLINPMQVNAKPAYKLMLSFEKKVPEFSIKTCRSARIKLRFSIEQDKWRIDITLIKIVATLSNPQDLKTSKARMLFKLSIDDFVAKAPWAFANHAELELEYIGDHTKLTPNDIVEGLALLSQYTDGIGYSDTDINDKYQAKIFDVAKLINPKQAGKFKSRFGLKQLSNQVIEMDKNIFINNVLPSITNYYITDKVDGTRAMILIDKTGTWAISNKLERVSNGMSSTYVLDTEYYEETKTYYIFDVLVINGKSVSGLPFGQRLKLFDQVKTAVADNINVQTKAFIRLTKKFNEQINQLDANKKNYETDGYVFTPDQDRYDRMVVYKGKPISKLSVDFLVKKCPQKLLGVRPYIANGKNLYLLFSGISKVVYGKLLMEMMKYHSEIFPNINKYNPPDYFPIQFQPSDFKFAYLYWGDEDNLDGEICEFVISNPTAPVHSYRWKLLRIREDRRVELARGNYFGNNYKVAEMTWLSYQNPLVFSSFTDNSYFQQSNSLLHKESRAFNSFVKSKIFGQYSNTKYVMDIASGKGQDLFRYAANNMTNVLFVEIDKTAIMELISRKHDFSKNRKSRDHLNVLTQQLDLNDPFKDNITKLTLSNISIPHGGFDLIVCNFALHYLISTKAAVVNIAKFINWYLKPGGRFVFTAFDGNDVVDLIGDADGWQSKTPGKFHIKRNYTTNSIELVGQKIDVLLPFSSNTYYTEYLVNIDFIEAIFGKYNLSLETNQSFSDWLPMYGKSSRMDSDDKLYTGLYHYYSFYKSVKK